MARNRKWKNWWTMTIFLSRPNLQGALDDSSGWTAQIGPFEGTPNCWPRCDDSAKDRPGSLVEEGREPPPVSARSVPHRRSPEAGTMTRPSHREAGMTLIEVMIAVVLFAILSVGILMSPAAWASHLHGHHANQRLMANRRSAYARPHSSNRNSPASSRSPRRSS